MRPRVHFIPGTMCTEALWAPVVERVSEVIEPVHVDIPLEADQPATVAALAERIEGPGAWVAAFSLGAYLSAAVLAAQPARIGRLMLVSSTPCALVASERTQRLAAMAWLEHHTYKGLSRTKALAMAGDGPQQARIVDTILAMDAALGGTVLMHQLRVTTERADLAAPLAAAGIPIDLVFSRDDPMLDARWRERFLRDGAGVRAHAFEGAGHMLPLSQADALAAILRGWVGSA
ncbi:alpha/beta fold hydrolase [Nitrogeniibacter aestuarii]|uniref:alpha/beta fold hydrolase n=1 Tax=Nitrogeniibacter aestuarii TaxID=2815343 RepID=UPI001E2F8649|nr:alpha/beta hydrolase [Nitrogeniibacter aestuarii]